MFRRRLQRARAAATRRRFPACEIVPVDVAALQQMGYSSQLGQDLLLDRHVFGGERDGVFVDVGAHDGVTMNNTLFLETMRGWTGLCIEPNPVVCDRAAAARSARCVPCAVGSQAGVAEFRVIEGYSEMLSGLTAHYRPAHLARIERELATRGGSSAHQLVPVRRLDEILQSFDVHHVDALCIDVEGAELDVLASISLREFGVRAVVLENNFTDSKLPTAMRRQGYQLFARLGWDECYVPAPLRLAGAGSRP